MQKIPVTLKNTPNSETFIISSADIYMMETGDGNHPYKVHTNEGPRYVHVPLLSIQEWLFDEGFLLLDSTNLINMNWIRDYDSDCGIVQLGNPSHPVTVKGIVSPIHREIVHKFLDMKTKMKAKEREQASVDLTDGISAIRPLLFHDILYDSLTLLPNRYGFQEKLKQALAQVRDQSAMMSLMFINIDRFQIVNTSLGYSAGDLLLQTVANRLQDSVSNCGILSRYGGDEFMILIPQVKHIEEVTSFANRLRLRFNKPLACGEHDIAITFSIGISLYPNDGFDSEALITHANIAMTQAQKKGGNTFQIYQPEMSTQTHHLLNMDYNFRQALEKEAFILHYQPMYKIKGGQIFGVEALVRWDHPNQGLIQPNKFIPFAEETGLIDPLNKWVLTEACRQVKSWQIAGLNPVILSVNISAALLQLPGFPTTVQKILEDTGFSPQLLFLEITESIAFKNMPLAIDNMNRLHRMGIRLTIDDFGTGYSTFNHLKKFHVHTLKIARSFIQDMHKNTRNATIVKSLLSLARDLNMNVLAEGIENDTDLDLLGKWGCDEAQGFLLSPPLTAEQFVELMTPYSKMKNKVTVGLF